MSPFLLDDKDVAEIKRIKRKIDTLSGDGVENTKDSVTIATVPTETPRVDGRDRFASYYYEFRLIVITGSSLQEGHQARWNYTFERITHFSEDGTYFEHDNIILDSLTALNLREFSHIAEPDSSIPWYVWGVDLHGSDIAAESFIPCPVGGGGSTGTHKTQVITPSIVVYDRDNTNAFTVFDGMGSIDGGCA